MLGDVLDLLACPHCQADLSIVDGLLRCASGHTFDIAKQGYVSLLRGNAPGYTGDTAAMIQARQAFLARGHYQPIVDALLDTVPSGQSIVDVGVGTGYYLAALLDALPGAVGLGLDLSKPALRAAARAHPRIGAAAADTWQRLPVRDGVFSLALNMFAPRNGPELSRILRPDGRLIVVAPTGRHLAELVAAAGLLTVDERKAERIGEQLAPWFTPEHEGLCEFTMTLSADDVAALAGMGPTARHADRATGVSRVAGPMTVTASVTVARYLKR